MYCIVFCAQEGALLYSFAGPVTAVDKDGQPVENQVNKDVQRERVQKRRRRKIYGVGIIQESVEINKNLLPI